MTAAELSTGRLGELHRRLAELVADDADARQIDIDRFVWTYAQHEAARALRIWAEETRNGIAAALAAAAEREADAALQSRGWDDEVEHLRQLAELPVEGHELVDVGATEDERLLRASLRELAEQEIRPYADSIHRDDLDIPESIIRAVAEFGLFGLSVPQELGGAEGAGSKAMLIATEELSRVSLAAGGSLMTRPEILIRALLRGGTREQQERWLPAIATGEQLVAIAVTEPDYGSDVGQIACRAKRLASGEWELHGTKQWCTFAGRSELVMVLARTGGPGHRGLSAFVLEKPAFGGRHFEHVQPSGGRLVGHAIPTIGYRGMHTFELAFDSYLLPADALIGGEEWLDRGFYLQMEGFSLGRLQTAGRAVGLMQAATEDAARYAQQRLVFGRPIAANPLARTKIGAMTLALQASRRLSYGAAALVDAGAGQMEASLAKLYASRLAEQVARDAAQLHGAMGYSEETPASRYFVDARVLPVFEGAEEVLSLRVIGKALLEAE